jgi:hypothetical protein
MSRFRRTLCIRSAHHRLGQALVEMALSITFIALLLAAVTDLGLAYKTYQTLVNATAEASSYLDVNPTVNCAIVSCPGGNPIAGANAIARQRFQSEQGTTIRHIASTLDVDADGIHDDVDSDVNIDEWVQITEADNTQVDNMSAYDPAATASECRERKAKPTNVASCYIVIRSRIIYRPFFLVPVLGDEMTIRAISVRRIVK